MRETNKNSLIWLTGNVWPKVFEVEEPESEVGFRSPPKSGPIKNEFYCFKVSRGFYRTLLRVIGRQESESEVGFRRPPTKPANQKRASSFFSKKGLYAV